MSTSKQENTGTIERPSSAVGGLPLDNDNLSLKPGERFLSNGILLRKRSQLVVMGVVLLVVASLLSYFVKPHAPLTELVTPDQEFPGYEAQYPGDNSLEKRVINSYGLAFVLFETPYSGANVRALENVRSWARENYQAAPDFLHPVSIKPEAEPNDTVIGALGYNLFASLRYAAEGIVGNILRNRIEDFHETTAYNSFNLAFFEVYGKDAESATLLARYQSDKAKSAIDLVIWAAGWMLGGFVGLTYLAFSPRRQRFDRIRQLLVAFWGTVAASYAIGAWMSNSIPAFTSAIVAAAVALFFCKPFILLTREDSSLKVFFITLSSRWIALSVWASYSAIAILVLTWIRCSLPDTSDPVTLLLSALSGNFLYDPEEGKRIVARVLGALWVCVSIWAFVQRDKDARISDELEAGLASL